MEATTYVCKIERLWHYLDVGWIGTRLDQGSKSYCSILILASALAASPC